MIRFKNAFLLTALMVFFFTDPVWAQTQKQAFTIQDGLKVRNLNIADITEDGRYAVVMTSNRRNRLGVNHGRFADPTYIQKRNARMVIIDAETGDQLEPYNRDIQARSLAWSPDGTKLAYFLRDGNRFYLHVYNREDNQTRKINLKTDKEISSNSLLEWRPDGSGILLELRADGWRVKADSMYKKMTEGPILVQNSTNDFLAWDRIWNMADRSILAEVSMQSAEVTELTEEGMVDDLNQSENGEFITYFRVYPQKTDYEREGDSDYALIKQSTQNSSDVDTLISKTDDRPNLTWNHAGDRYTLVDEGKVYVRSVDSQDSTEITANNYEFIEDGDTTEVKYSVKMWRSDDSQLLLESDRGYYLANPNKASLELVYEYPENKDKAPRRNVVEWSQDGRYLYMTYSARDKWERGITRYDLQSRKMESLLVNSDLYDEWTFSEDGNRIFYQRSDGDHPSNLFTAEAGMDKQRQLTELNPWIQNKKVSHTELVQYMDVDGDTLYGVLYYPVDYEKGKKYPLVANVYEDYFDNGFVTKMNILANQGYFVFRPSVNFDTGYPGEAWLKGVTTGINKLMERGLVDGSKLGVQGVSYGGYAVNLLITQTDRFAAAVNVSGKVDMVSFLGDSPKITTRNYDAAEVGQDRIGETLWEAQDKYIDHSAVFFADRIETPLLMLSGNDDWNVPATNQREMYYAMRRLGKEVKWVHYFNGGHGAGRAGRVEDYIHHYKTLLDWYDSKFYPDQDKSEQTD